MPKSSIQVEKKTRVRLNVERAKRDCHSYDQLLNQLLDEKEAQEADE